MGPASGLWQAIFWRASHDIVYGGFQADAMADGDIDRFYSGPGSQYCPNHLLFMP